jgi:hypothetical protein
MCPAMQEPPGAGQQTLPGSSPLLRGRKRLAARHRNHSGRNHIVREPIQSVTALLLIQSVFGPVTVQPNAALSNRSHSRSHRWLSASRPVITGARNKMSGQISDAMSAIKRTKHLHHRPRTDDEDIYESLGALLQSGPDATLDTPIRARSKSSGSRSERMSPLVIARSTSALIAALI